MIKTNSLFPWSSQSSEETANKCLLKPQVEINALKKNKVSQGRDWKMVGERRERLAAFTWSCSFSESFGLKANLFFLPLFFFFLQLSLVSG